MDKFTKPRSNTEKEQEKKPGMKHQKQKSRLRDTQKTMEKEHQLHIWPPNQIPAGINPCVEMNKIDQ